MDAELKAYLDQRFTAIDQRFTAIDQRFTGIDQRFTSIDEQFSALESRLEERIEKTETRLLTEFWKWGRAADLRFRRLDAGEATTVERLMNIEERLFTLERKALGSKD